jgi:hypothetical protein
MVLGSTQPLTEMSTRNLPGGKGLPANKADNLTAICDPIVQNRASQPPGRGAWGKKKKKKRERERETTTYTGNVTIAFVSRPGRPNVIFSGVGRVH